MKASVVVTTLNEAGTIGALLDSLKRQTKKPDEVIIVDAGSDDGTLEIVKGYKKSLMIQTIEVKGANRSQARNKGIKAAKNGIICVTDAGCVADRQWLSKLTRPFSDQKVISVAGYYRPVTETVFTKCAAPFMAVMPDQFDPETFLPSSRSVAFRKGAAWYPEKLNFCEDLVFAQKLKAKGKMKVVKDAVVAWRLPDDWWPFFDRIYNYARGDVMAKYRPHTNKIITVWLRYLVFIIIKPLFSLYLFWPVIKHYRYVKDWRAFVYLPLLQVTADFGVMAGSASAIISPDDSAV